MLQSLTFVLSGQAGQGLATIEKLLSQAIKNDYYVFSTPEVMSRVRGGNNTVEIRVASQPVDAYKHTIDILFLLNDHSFYRLHDRINEKTVIFGEKEFIDEDVLNTTGATFSELKLEDLASDAGSTLYSNTVLFGFISGLLDLNTKNGEDPIRKNFESKSDKIIENNIKAFHKGYELGKAYDRKIAIEKTDIIKNHRIISGTEAVGIGALAGGVNYIASYPMSPGTGLLQYLAEKGNDFGVIVEQAEDEIAALNMGIGAWYAGARSIVTTSGGGFALMEEAVSLAGITESPCVIHVAQRPGPGTGLPTRTEQADLNLVVYAGHGEFPRIVLAPGSITDGVLLTQRAFYLADKYQVPVFVLTDQFYVDSNFSIEPLELSDQYLESHVVESDEDYLRYKVTENGLSPRSIPGYGKGLVKIDSDEHDERGSITEDFNVRVTMNEKRLSKQDLILQEYIEPELIGPKDYKKLIISWGSTYGVIKEAVQSTDHEDLAYLHLKEVYPLHESITKYIDQADDVAIFEINATSQLANLIKLHLDRDIKTRINKYNGTPFSIEEIDANIKEVF